MSSLAKRREAGPAAAFVDLFEEDRQAGRVIGSQGQEGAPRLGVDSERVLSIDNRALRIQPLNQPGWGRSAILYGPYERRNGLALAVFALNGLNASQTGPLPDPLLYRLARWVRGSGVDPPWRKLLRWSIHGDKRRFFRRLRFWIRNQQGSDIPRLDENLAVGWYPEPAPRDPTAAGHGFIVHADGPENGELWASIAGRQQLTHPSLQNLQVYYVIVLRERGAAYYAAAGPGAEGLSAFPALQPLAVDPFQQESPLYGGVSQSVLGQIGFRVDTRIYGIAVQPLADYSTWYGTAQAADELTGEGSLEGSAASVGGNWSVAEGELTRSEYGLQGAQASNLAVLRPPGTSGLLHVLLEAQDTAALCGGLVWGYQDLENHARLRLDGGTLRLEVLASGQAAVVQQEGVSARLTEGPNSFQVSHRGRHLYCALNGELAFGGPVEGLDAGAEGACGVWMPSGRSGARMSHFEAHPSRILLPPQLHLGEPWQPAETRKQIADDFAGGPGPLAGRKTPDGSKDWGRLMGQGTFLVTGEQSLRVKASAQEPNPGRTAYTVDWDDPACADLQVDITTPGTSRGQGERCRAGLIFWQDPDHYLIVNTWLNDTYRGASISSFFHLNGYEDLYDAVWTNVGDRVTWGKRFTLRVAFDGLHYLAHVDGEAVLYRALTDVYPRTKRLSIRQIGLVANWEWGNDTGSVFERFTARYRSGSPGTDTRA